MELRDNVMFRKYAVRDRIIAIEKTDFGSTSNGERPMIQALPRLVGQHRCGIFGRKCSLVDLQQEQKYGYDKQTCISDNLSHKF